MLSKTANKALLTIIQSVLTQLDVALSTRASETTVAAILTQIAAVTDVDVIDRAARLLGTVSPVVGSVWDVSDRTARLLGTVSPVAASTWDVSDRVARLLGTVSPVAASVWDVADRAARLLGTVSPVAASVWDIADRAARLLGVVYGSQGNPLQQKATTFGLLTEETPAAAIGDLADVVAAAAATQLIAASTPCRSVVVRALKANTGNVRVGSASVTATRGAEVSAGDSIILAVNNVNLVYIFGNGTDSVSITYVN